MCHLLWILIATVIGFFIPFLFANNQSIPVDFYYLIYFVGIIALFTVYIRQTGLDLKKTLSTNLVVGLIFGLIFAFIQARNVFSRPETTQFTGSMLIWAILWRGIFYGTIDGLLLSVFPYVVTWKAFNVDKKPLILKIAFTFLAWIFVLVITTAYHAGYTDFRSKKLIQPTIGNSIISLPMFLSGSPVAAPIAHIGMHIAAVIHSPQTDLFLPPHR